MQRMMLTTNRSQGAHLPELNHALSNPEMNTHGRLPTYPHSVTKHKINVASQRRIAPSANSISLISQQNMDRIYNNNNVRLMGQLADNKIKRQISQTKLVSTNEGMPGEVQRSSK